MCGEVGGADKKNGGGSLRFFALGVVLLEAIL